MRTPLLTVIFFLQFVINLLNLKKMSRVQFSQAKNFCNLMMQQLNFCQTFVDDLLDLQKMRTGALEIVNEVFDPNEVLELIQGIFAP